METVQIDILNPKAKKILSNLTELNLIKINTTKTREEFSSLLKKLRSKSEDEISLDEITKEVEQVRGKSD